MNEWNFPVLLVHFCLVGHRGDHIQEIVPLRLPYLRNPPLPPSFLDTHPVPTVLAACLPTWCVLLLVMLIYLTPIKMYWQWNACEVPRDFYSLHHSGLPGTRGPAFAAPLEHKRKPGSGQLWSLSKASRLQWKSLNSNLSQLDPKGHANSSCPRIPAPHQHSHTYCLRPVSKNWRPRLRTAQRAQGLHSGATASSPGFP
jgi:hypothetical protein